MGSYSRKPTINSSSNRLPEIEHGTIYENTGRPNFGKELEQPSGVINPSIASFFAQPLSIGNWEEKHVPAADLKLDAATGENWSPADIAVEDGDVEPNSSAIYRAAFTVESNQVEKYRSLTFGRIDDDGIVYLNRRKIGESHNWAKAQTFNIAKDLRAGRNSIVVLVTNRTGRGGLARARAWKPCRARWI